MTELTTHKASDRRVYDGAPCSDMDREWSHTDGLEKRLLAADPTAAVTYFPMEGKYLAFTNTNILENPHLEGPPRILTGVFHVEKQEALIEAIRVLEAPGYQPGVGNSTAP